MPEAPSFKYHNTSVLFSLLFSNLGKVYNLDPPLIPGMNIGVDQVIGTKFYGGTGIHVNALIGKTDDAVAGIRSWGNIKQQLLGEFRKQYGDLPFKEIKPSGMVLLPAWDRKFDDYVKDIPTRNFFGTRTKSRHTVIACRAINGVMT